MLQAAKNAVQVKVAAMRAGVAAASDAVRAAVIGLVPAPAPVLVPVRVRNRRSGHFG
ncbi:hypothetical protein MKK84_09265 [Methylobacterium sp. E-065]|uniref:hypothetical protein n=1 Tax=Methylobacterium sp. E-065 TaxID=2836583 RepID=UPI001FB98DE8|nr:hypothetical protein [Methylobacterium sp. E-065]MCJ2017606.1 hypothetical protein [Methylobacterium sp. E-065]